MKKILCVVLALLTFAIGSIPAAADETGFSDPWIDILQFGGIVGQDSLSFVLEKGVHAIAEVQNDGFAVSYIELVFSASDGISGLFVTDRGIPALDSNWVVKPLTNGLFVAYCYFGLYQPLTFMFDFYYTGGAPRSPITLLSVRALPYNVSSGKLSGQTSMSFIGSSTKYGSFTDGNTSSIISFSEVNGKSGIFNVYFTYDQRLGWDFIDFAVHLSNVLSVTSVTAYCDDVVVPVYYNTVPYSYSPVWMTRFHLDLRNLPNSGSVVLQVGFRSGAPDSSFYVYSATGTVDVKSVPLLSRWFKKLHVWFQQLGNSITGGFDRVVNELKVWFVQLGNTITDGFDRVVNAISPTFPSDPLPDSEDNKNEMQENQDIINSVTQPTFNESSFDISGLIGPDNSIGVILATPLTKSSYIFNVFLMIFTLALGSYILFGKR